MLTSDRKSSILHYINENQTADVSTLAQLFNVSEVTIRRDLNELHEAGQVRRVHGGAERIFLLTEEPQYIRKLKENNQSKQRIAKESLRFIQDNMVIFLDAGTTIFEIAKVIIEENYYNLTLITNDLNTAYLIHQSNKNNLIIVGGNVTKGNGNIQGTLSNEMLNNINPQLSFIGSSSIDNDLKLYSPDEQKIYLKKSIMINSSKTILAVDSTKFEKRSLYYITDMNKFDGVITDYKFLEEQKIILRGSTEIIQTKA